MKTVLGLVLLLGLIVQLVAVVRFSQFADGLHRQVGAGRAAVLLPDGVPDLIVDYAVRAGVDMDRLARVVSLTQRAQMQLKRGGGWQPLVAKQTISTGEAQFVWQAEQRRGPLLMFRVIDAFVAGRGRLNVRLLGSIPVANYSGPDADRGEAMRYLSELIWAPDAMVGNSDLIWQGVSDTEVRVGLMLPDGLAQVTFRFDDAGDIVGVVAEKRPATDDQGNPVLLDWRCTVFAYGMIGGRRMPIEAEVGYLYADGYEAYWRGEIVGYELGF